MRQESERPEINPRPQAILNLAPYDFHCNSFRQEKVLHWQMAIFGLAWVLAYLVEFANLN
jgi:hypothetical protein